MFQSLYLHWPFNYTSANSNLSKRYVVAIKKEIHSVKKGSTIKALFIGGNVPNSWPKQLLLDTSGTLSNVFNFAKNIEFTIEIDPITICNLPQLLFWKSVGINRLCLRVLLEDSPKKTIDKVFLYINQAKEVFKNISLDLCFRSLNEWNEIIETVVLWPIKHISLDLSRVIEDQFIGLYQWVNALFENNGFNRYELCHFAKKGFESQYQTSLWNRKQVRGFGCGSWSFDGKTRFKNESSIKKYISKIESHQDAIIFSEQLNEEEVFLEKLMMCLRKSNGIQISEFTQKLHKKDLKQFLQKLIVLKKEKYIIENEGRIKLSIKGLMVENFIITTLVS